MDAQYVYEYAVPVTFPASQADTFAALSDEKALKVWFAEHAEIDAREGGAYRFWESIRSTPSDAAMRRKRSRITDRFRL